MLTAITPLQPARPPVGGRITGGISGAVVGGTTGGVVGGTTGGVVGGMSGPVTGGDVVVVDVVVVVVVVVGETTVVSVRSPHALDTDALLRSPLKVAIHRYVPVSVGVNAGACAVPTVGSVVIVSGCVELDTGVPLHVSLSGPNNANVTVPPGDGPSRPRSEERRVGQE